MRSPLRTDDEALAAVAALVRPLTPHGPDRSYAVLPSPDRPRYVLPTSRRHARGASLRPGRGRGDAASRLLVGTALRVGAGGLLPGRVRIPDGSDGDPGLRRHLGTLLGRDDVDLAVALGAPRPNRKPVVQVIGRDGTTHAWVKLGVDGPTDELVAHEAEALLGRRPADPVVTPEVLATGDWRGHRLLVLAPLRMTETTDDLDLTPDVVRAVAGPLTTEVVLDGAWWQGLLAQAADPAIDADGRLGDLLDRLAPALAGREWPFGTWHGDLAPWNATWVGDRLHLWDWERSATPVPLGLDLAHNRFMVAVLRDGATPADAIAAVRIREDPTFAALGYGRDDVPLVIAAYLATLRARYASDARFGALGAAGPVVAAIDGDPTLGGAVTA